jgi:hypothetical protein
MSKLGEVMGKETDFMASTVKRDVFYDCWGLVAAVGVGGGCCWGDVPWLLQKCYGRIR